MLKIWPLVYNYQPQQCLSKSNQTFQSREISFKDNNLG
ncbi:hypothetical protein DFQ12_5501 [Sphingobacterium detergens]|uniref:Uncharacterized protein n=1 Tax=Sphingobacterium detergens TaxID=1145106 RepID=A0A420ADZ0_SPHD1|nr:hypothetical protein DFQ12_5501 [Sphingobacterium detergens]